MKKNCNIIRDLLPLYIDNVCSEESKNLVDEHLKTCVNCNKYVNDLKLEIKESNSVNINIIKGFSKKISFKIFRDVILYTFLILVVYGILAKAYNYNLFIMGSDTNMKILLHDESDGRWNFQFNVPMDGKLNTKVVHLKENGNNVNLVFLSHKYSLDGMIKTNKDSKAINGMTPEIDYKNINLKDDIRVYYIDKDIEKMNWESDLNKIINDAKLIFTKEQTNKNMICTMNNQTYKYNLLYYDVNEQIIKENFKDDEMPSEILMEGYNMNGSYKTIGAENASAAFEKLDNYVTTRGGSCSLK